MISETALRNHEELFPNHKWTLKLSDPELIEVFDNFAFDEIVSPEQTGRENPFDSNSRSHYRGKRSG